MASGLGIDLGASAIKAVRVRRRGATWQVIRAWRVEDPAPPPPPVKPGKVAELPPRQLPATARTEMRRAGLSGGGMVGLSGRDLMVKYVSTPPVPPWKLQMMMDLEIKGTSGAEVCGDFANLDIPGDLTREMVALVAVARSNYVEQQMRLVREAGMSAEWCCPSGAALFNVFLASGQYRPGETVAVLDIGRDNLDLVIQRDGVLYFARSATGGARRFTDAVDGVLGLGYAEAERFKCKRAAIVLGGGASAKENKVSGALCEVADGMLGALRSATLFCKAQAKIKKLEVERIVLAGGGSRLEGLPEYLARKSGLPVDVLDPASRMDISGLPADQQALFEGPACAEMSAAVGLAMTAADPGLFRLEVIPDAVVSSRRFWRGTAWALAAAAALAGLVAADVAGAARSKAQLEVVNEALRQKLEGNAAEKLVGLREQLNGYRAEAAKNDALVRKARLLVSPAQRNVPVLGFIKLLRETTPEGIVLGKLVAGRPTDGVAAPANQVEVEVHGTADRAVLAEADEFLALENYRNKLLAESGKLAFKIDKPEITTGDRPEGSRRPFVLKARIFTLGVSSEEEEPASDQGEGEGEGGTPDPGTEPPVVGPEIVPRGLPSKPSPFVPPPPPPPPKGNGEDGEEKKGGEDAPGQGGAW